MLIQKQFSIKWLSVALIMCLMFSVNSCGNDDDDDGNGNNVPSYVGTWELEDDGFMQELVITESTFKMTLSLFEEDVWIDLMLVEGSYTVSGDIFTLTVTRIGILREDMSGMDYYTPDDPDWDLILEDEFDMDGTFEVKFKVTGNQLTVISDENGDGFFDPVEEGETFTKA